MSEENIDLFEQALENPEQPVSEVITVKETVLGTCDSNVEVRNESESGKGATHESPRCDDDEGKPENCAAESEVDGSEESEDSEESDGSDGSDDSDDSDGSGQEEISPVLEEEEEEDAGPTGPIRSVHEIAEEPIMKLPEDFAIGPDTTIHEIGMLKSAFDNNAIVAASLSGEQRVLKEGSILCLEDRTLIGPLCEVFGQLQAPFYRVSFDKSESKTKSYNEIKERVGAKVFYVVPEAHWVDTFQLKQLKGTDASNGFDEELPEHEQEFSDDEKEMAFKRKKKLTKKRKSESDTEEPNKQSITSRRNPIPCNNRTTTYQPRNHRGERNSNTNPNYQENSRNRNWTHGKNSKPPVPTNPMQLPPGFDQRLMEQTQQSVAYQSQNYNAGFYQSPQPPIFPGFGIPNNQNVYPLAQNQYMPMYMQNNPFPTPGMPNQIPMPQFQPPFFQPQLNNPMSNQQTPGYPNYALPHPQHSQNIQQQPYAAPPDHRNLSTQEKQEQNY